MRENIIIPANEIVVQAFEIGADVDMASEISKCMRASGMEDMVVD